MMGYYNTVFRLTHRTFCERLSAAGAAGFIVPDLPIEEYHDLSPLSEAHGLNPVALFTPTNTDARLAEIGRHGRGFVYGVARRGVTGKPTDLKAGIDRAGGPLPGGHGRAPGSWFRHRRRRRRAPAPRKL